MNITLAPNAFTANGSLVRPILVDHLTDERLKAEAHSWHTLLPVALYNLPMTLEIMVLGQSRSGRRHSAWSTGFCHPRNRALRFQKHTDKRGLGTGFADSWRKVWREEYAQISREDWIRAMVADGMVEQLTKRITVNPLPQSKREGVLALASRKLSRVQVASGKRTGHLGQKNLLPDPSYSACDWPRPCPFQRCCYSEPELTPEGAGGFVRIDG